MTKKQFIKCIAFIVATLMMIVILCDMFETENTKNFDQNMYTYRNLPDDMLDAIYLGTSGVDRFWIGAKAFEEYGLSIYPVSFDAFPAWLYTNVLEETLPKQDVKLILIDIRAFYQNNTSLNRMDVRSRRYLDSLPFFSWNRIKAAFKTMRYIHEVHPEDTSSFDASYLFSVIKFHSMWSDEYSLNHNLGNKKQKHGGFYISDKNNIKQLPQERVVFDTEKYRELDPTSEKALYELIDYIKKHNLNVLFVDTPQFLDKKELGRANNIYKIFEENDLDYVHFYKENSDEFTVDLDNETEFYDESHVNYYGAEKFTPVLAQYLVDNYDFADRREDKVASEFWSGKYEKIKKHIAKLEKAKAEKEKKKDK